ncbi:hypothetical protein HYU18_02210 [Candidatus Woesearchaeota archaeon]|nr:hypothetical protein [Candidatus Woesearchaeota archaeon]
MEALEEYSYDDDGVDDFYRDFRNALEDDSITAEEEGFMFGFCDFDEL